jgi:lipopolysaccharide assembly protein B
MDIDITWLLLGLPLAFVLGWLASRFDIRQLRIDNKRSPKAYFKGLNHLLNEQQDQAIDAFIEAVQKDPDTSELHFALGNLFRRRGEYDRAVRVHEHLMARGDLPKADHERAQHALALDYLKAGLLDRAEDALGKLEGTKFEQEARLARMAIFERTRDWPAAQRIAEQLQAAKPTTGAGGAADFSGRIAHYLCEQAELAEPEQQRTLLQQAIEIAPQAGRPRIALANVHVAQGDANAALNVLLALTESAQSAIPLVAHQLAELAIQCERTDAAQSALQSFYDATHSLDALQALGRLQAEAQGESAMQALQMAHLKAESSLVVAAQLMKTNADTPPEIKRALDKAAGPLRRYRCAACGFEASRHFWQCPGCQSWDSYSTKRVEEL